MNDLALILLTLVAGVALAALVTAIDRRWPTDPDPGPTSPSAPDPAATEGGAR